MNEIFVVLDQGSNHASRAKEAVTFELREAIAPFGMQIIWIPETHIYGINSHHP